MGKIVLILLSIILSLGLVNLKPSNDPTVFFDKNSHELEEIHKLENLYGENNNLIITISSKTTVFTIDNITAIQKLSNSLQNIEGSPKVNSITKINRLKPTIIGLKVHPLFSKIDTTELQKAKEYLLDSENLFTNYLISPNGKTCGIELQFNMDSITQGSENLIIQEVKDSCKSILSQENLTYYVTGGLAINAVFTQAGMLDSITLTPIMILVIFVGLILFVKSLRQVIAILLVILPIPIITLGLSGWLQTPFNPTTAVVPILALAISLANSIHIVSAYFTSINQNIEPIEFINKSVKKPIIYTSFTTIVGFLTLNFSETPPFRYLGNLSAFAVFLSLLYSLFLLPFLLTKSGSKCSKEWHFVNSQKLTKTISKNYKIITLISVALFVLSLISLPKLKNDDSFINYFDNRFDFRKETDSTISKLTGIDYLQISIPAKDSISDINYLNRVSKLEREIQNSIVYYSISLPKLMLEVQNRVSKNKVSQLNNQKKSNKIITQITSREMPHKLISDDGKSTQIFIIFKKVKSSQIRNFAKNVKVKAKKQGFNNIEVGSTSYLFANLSESNNRAMKKGMLLSFAIITLLFGIITRNIRLTIISFVVNTFPIIISFGIWALLIGKEGLGLTIVAPMVMGIIVDDTLHFIYHYLDYKKRGNSTIDAIEKTDRVIIHPIIITSIILSISFIVLTFSGFSPTKEMGIVSTLIIVLALLSDAFVLPSLLLLTKEKEQ